MDYLQLCDSAFNYIIWWESTVSALQMALTLRFSLVSARDFHRKWKHRTQCDDTVID